MVRKVFYFLGFLSIISVIRPEAVFGQEGRTDILSKIKAEQVRAVARYNASNFPEIHQIEGSSVFHSGSYARKLGGGLGMAVIVDRKSSTVIYFPEIGLYSNALKNSGTVSWSDVQIIAEIRVQKVEGDWTLELQQVTDGWAVSSVSENCNTPGTVTITTGPFEMRPNHSVKGLVKIKPLWTAMVRDTPYGIYAEVKSIKFIFP